VDIGGSVIIIGNHAPASDPNQTTPGRSTVVLQGDDNVFRYALEAGAKAARALEQRSTGTR
jgi:uncharacterized glyoxalase superfamily protein PhnB